MNYLLSLILLLSLFSCNSTDGKEKEDNICNTTIKQPKADPFDIEQFKVYKYYGGYVVGRHELTAATDKDGTIHIGSDMKYDTIFVRLVYDPRYEYYYPWPDNQPGAYNTITEKDSCAAKLHWHRYTKQWKE